MYKDWNVPIPTETLDTTAAHMTADVPQDLAPLTRSYRHFSVGPDVTHILVYMPNVPGIHGDAIEKFHDRTRKVEDWTQDVGTHAGEDICSADPAKQLVDLVLVVSNTSATTPGPADRSIKLLAAHTACDHYTATLSGHYSFYDSSHHLDETWQASGLVFERDPATPWDFDVASGSVTWSLSGTVGDCSLSAGPGEHPRRARPELGRAEYLGLRIRTAAPELPAGRQRVAAGQRRLHLPEGHVPRAVAPAAAPRYRT